MVVIKEGKMARKPKRCPNKDEIAATALARAPYLCRALCVEYYYVLSTQQGHWLTRAQLEQYPDLYYAIRNFTGGIQDTRRMARERFGGTFSREDLALGQIRTGWTQSMLKAGLERLTLELGRLPLCKDIDEAFYLPKAQTVRRVFGRDIRDVRQICDLGRLLK